MKNLFCLFFLASCVCVTTDAAGATISAGDVTSNLDGTVFFDNARTGGGDATANEGGTITVQRFFDFDGNGTISAPGVPGVVTIESFGFATSGAAAANDATEVDLTFIYLGQDQNPNSPDDVVIGTERVSYNHTGGGEYFVDLDTDPSALIDGLGSRFRIVVEPVDLDGGLVESIRMKTRPAGEQTLGHQGPTMSLSGSFVAIPEPATCVMAFLAGATAMAVRRR